MTENLKSLKDQELLSQIKILVKKERYLLTEILHHLREVEKRRLFSELGYQSLFEYTVKELKYSEGQAGRRIQAMRLIKELPEVEEKIKQGKLSLSHLSKAQSYFREVNKQKINSKGTGNKMDPKARLRMDSNAKLHILQKLEHKSIREAEKVLIEELPMVELPKEKERPVSKTHTEMKFIMDESLKAQLEEVRSLLGVKAIHLSFSELLQEMARLSIESLQTKRFGKKRSAEVSTPAQELQHVKALTPAQELQGIKVSLPKSGGFNHLSDVKQLSLAIKDNRTPAQESHGVSKKSSSIKPSAKISNQVKSPQRSLCARYVSRKLRFEVWRRDQGKCTICQSKHNLNYDHIRPVALGGESTLENLRLLCFHCNQRRAIKTFGERFVS